MKSEEEVCSFEKKIMDTLQPSGKYFEWLFYYNVYVTFTWSVVPNLFEYKIVRFLHIKTIIKAISVIQLVSRKFIVLASLWQDRNNYVIEKLVLDISQWPFQCQDLFQRDKPSFLFQFIKAALVLWISYSEVENPSSHKHEVENCVRMVKAFLANAEG